MLPPPIELFIDLFISPAPKPEQKTKPKEVTFKPEFTTNRDGSIEPNF